MALILVLCTSCLTYCLAVTLTMGTTGTDKNFEPSLGNVESTHAQPSIVVQLVLPVCAT